MGGVLGDSVGCSVIVGSPSCEDGAVVGIVGCTTLPPKLGGAVGVGEPNSSPGVGMSVDSESGLPVDAPLGTEVGLSVVEPSLVGSYVRVGDKVGVPGSDPLVGAGVAPSLDPELGSMVGR